MATTRTICTECKSVVTLPEPAEVGDVVSCPKCEAYFTVPKTKMVAPGTAKPAAPAKPAAAVPAKPKITVQAVEDDEDDLPPPKKKPVVAVEDDDEDDDEEEEERPKKKKKRTDGGPGKKKKRKKQEEKSFKDSPVRYAILGVLVLVMLVGAYFLYKKMMKGDPPEIVVRTTILDDESVLHEDGSIVKKDGTRIPPPAAKNEPKTPAKGGGGNNPQTGMPSVDRQKATNNLKQLGLAYQSFIDATGKPPKAPADLLPYVENKAALIKDVTDGVYVLFMNVDFRALTGGTSNTILGYVHDVPKKGGMALFADGSVRNVNVADFEAAPKAGK